MQRKFVPIFPKAFFPPNKKIPTVGKGGVIGVGSAFGAIEAGIEIGGHLAAQ